MAGHYNLPVPQNFNAGGQQAQNFSIGGQQSQNFNIGGQQAQNSNVIGHQAQNFNVSGQQYGQTMASNYNQPLNHNFNVGGQQLQYGQSFSSDTVMPSTPMIAANPNINGVSPDTADIFAKYQNEEITTDVFNNVINAKKLLKKYK